ncbi:MAG TPA: hypothetical protein VH559_13050 [Gemmatimonadaceae bacterium]
MRRLLFTSVVLMSARVISADAQGTPDSVVRRQQRTIDSISAALRAVQARVDSLSTVPPTEPAAAAPAPAARAAGAYMNIGFDGLVDAGWSSVNNPDLVLFQGGDHDPHVRGFTVPNAELTLDGAVDPYFKGFANIVYKLDRFAETNIELEEVYAITTSLPYNLQAKIGQFLAEFGRQNQQHPHAWAFIDQPLVMTQMFGPDGLRSQGVRLSWLLPTPWYTEAMVAVLNSAGGTAFSFRADDSPNIHGGVIVPREVAGLGDMLYVPRITTSADLTDNTTLVAGVSGAFGPNNSGSTSRTQIYGADLYWKWKSPRAAAGFPFVSLQTEGMYRNYGAALRARLDDPQRLFLEETLHSGGVYAQVLWGIRPRIVAGLRYDWINADTLSFEPVLRPERSRISPNFTWYPTEFSKLRFQYNFDRRQDVGNDSSFWVQFEFILGAHAAHKF